MILLNCDLLELEVRDSYEKSYCDYISFHLMTMFSSTSVYKVVS